ncbi:uncharacterized protein B0H18DRAFT_1121176 [Fomitopsis serialis]|uniref:uncharacterized protein n=1 Tax=Fomitopsis serialis TaxID=139415 RepID=UPI00200832F3|nr:uncharacterized protein B0H18DRAFT_1121176 [Neoantrodia serialis]KAH9921877.1 hypothetical protein B0H18DRAFT_1121176 [Neoantrodia serialis]
MPSSVDGALALEARPPAVRRTSAPKSDRVSHPRAAMTVHKDYLPSARTSVQYVSYVSESLMFASVALSPSQSYATPSLPSFTGRHPTWDDVPAPPAYSPPGPSVDTQHSVPLRGTSPPWTAARAKLALGLVHYIAHGIVYCLLSGTSALVCTSAGYIFLISREPYRSSNRDTILCVSSIGGAAVGLIVFTLCWSFTQIEPGGTGHDAAGRAEQIGWKASCRSGVLWRRCWRVLGAYVGARMPGRGLGGGLDEVHAFRLGAVGS